jgi:hypothetical protein
MIEEEVFKLKKRVLELEDALQEVKKDLKEYKEENFYRWDNRFKILLTKIIKNGK